MGGKYLPCNGCINFNKEKKQCKQGHSVGYKSSRELDKSYSWQTLIGVQDECSDWNDGSKQQTNKILEQELEEQRKAILQDVDKFLDNVEHKQILDEFSMFIDTLDECLRLQEPKEFEALKRLFESLVEQIGG